ncbi:MAG TPA: hypothetical protein VJR29_11495 [bacterium]|nr:hypothetical protein [bacterium]
MSFSPLRNDLYLDQYFSSPEPAPVEGGYSDGGSYESFEEDFLIEEGLDPVDASAGEGVAEEEYIEEEPLEPSSSQKEAMEWLEEHGEDLEEEFVDAQDRLAEILGGSEELKPEERKAKLEEVESTLDEIERELEEYADKEESLRDSELPEELWEFDAVVDVESMEDDLESIRKDLGTELETAEEEATEIAEAEAKAEEDEKEGRALKDQLNDVLGYLNGGKDRLYFTAKVWGDKHIKDYHEDITQYALSIISQMADAAASGDWTQATASIEALANDKADNALGLIGFLLSEFAPQTLDKLPSSLLEVMADGVRRGNEPDHAGIYYINQNGKYDTPKDDRRRKDMGHVGFTYLEAAEIFEAKADANRAREEAEAEAAGDSEDEVEADG